MKIVDHAGLRMSMGGRIAAERISAVNDNQDSSHFHSYYELLYMERGVRYFIISDRVYRAEKGDLVLFPPNIMHHAYSDDGVEFQRTLICFRPDEAESEGVRAVLPEGSGVYRIKNAESGFLSQLVEQLLQAQEGDSVRREELMHALLNALLLCMLEYSTRSREEVPEEKKLVTRVIRYIGEHYSEPLSLNGLAEQFFVSPSHLCRIFKKSTNQTVTFYINNTRIMMAQRRLVDTEDSITEIGLSSGFSNVTHFNRVFRQITGTSPSQLRKNLK